MLILTTEAGRIISFRLKQLPKARSAMDSTPSGTTTVSRALQLWNRPNSIIASDSGRTALFSPRQSVKTDFPILSTDFGKRTSAMFSQYAKAESPMDFKVSGRLTMISSVWQLNA